MEGVLTIRGPGCIGLFPLTLLYSPELYGQEYYANSGAMVRRMSHLGSGFRNPCLGFRVWGFGLPWAILLGGGVGFRLPINLRQRSAAGKTDRLHHLWL